MKENDKKSELVEIDDVDREIINLFNNDGRMSYRKIAKRLDVSIGTVHNRME
ncbi:MAG: AsnC family transcriptional regulator, partial [Methanobacterium sp.]|nr:AsnC family transcriptional regulator [Methanobacterium sp.]